MRKSIFHDQTTKQLSLKISELVQDKLKFFVGGENSPFHLSGDKKWNCLITGCNRTDCFKLVHSIEKRLWKPKNEAKLFLYSSWWWTSKIISVLWYGFRRLFSIEWTNLKQSVLLQPVIKQFHFLSPERWKGEFSPPTKILRLSWTNSDILRDNCLVVWSWNMDFLGQSFIGND